jgi:chemotaxis signal transduction protein
MGILLAAVRIGAADIGIPADAVLQALPAAGARNAPPRRRGALCAVVEHEGRLLPVVDLARWVEVGRHADDASADALQHARIVLLRDGTRRIGLRVDALRGLVDAEGDAERLHRDDDPDEVFHTVARTRGPDMLLSVLDVGRLATLAMTWHEEAQDGGDVAPAAALAAAGPRVQYALMRTGGTRLAMPVADVAEVLPMPHVERSGFGLAYCVWRGRQVPVLPAAAMVEPQAGAEAAPGATLLAVIEHGGLALGVPVDAALGMAPFARDQDGLPALDGIATTTHDADGPVLLIDSARLLARFPEAALSRPDGAGAAARAGTAQRRNPTTHIVFEADGFASTPIDAVEQVLPLAPDDGGAAGTLAWRGKTIALADLRRGGGRGNGNGDGDAGHVVVVRQDGCHAAYVVTRVHLLIPPQGGTLYRLGGGAGAVEFISVGDGAGQASYRTLDLTRAAA